MANWGVALAQRPLVPRNRKKQRHHLHASNVRHSPSIVIERCSGDAMLRAPSFQDYGNVFKHICRPEDGTHDCYDLGCERITINVSGLQFTTRRNVFEAHPSTLLGELHAYQFTAHLESIRVVFS